LIIACEEASESRGSMKEVAIKRENNEVVAYIFFGGGG